MKKVTTAALAASVFALTAVSAFAFSDEEQIEQECREAAIAEEIAADEVENFVTECVAETMEAEDAEATEEAQDKD